MCPLRWLPFKAQAWKFDRILGSVLCMATPWENKDRECRLRLKTNFNNDYYGSRDEIVRGDIGEEYDTPAFLDENTNAVSQKL
ncbi:uncharacterized protein PHALS_10648 [Plasmopara halstedii]|uniref:Uncharacterized protein n=1 Tax=Plasmopara halstedii TaxID=4781 RepID=A0A0P1AGV8_PLAHL|nr:uncharacterized protein PHALS_10648 [Plasmopara halstedii]CEG40449.1 hypothetical protein PHALS_10648 [Plasmopara halstedii]|eukprot:XP_024576818.1 hypothetical protein PHALS_10648 [Plasmopara halstedii]